MELSRWMVVPLQSRVGKSWRRTPNRRAKTASKTSLARRQLQWLVMRREDGSFFLAASVVHISLTQAES